MSSIKDRVWKGSLWVTLSRALTNALATASTFILAWHLAPADFGVVAIGTTFILILTSVTEMSLSAVLVRHENPDKSHLDAAWTLGLVRGIVLALIGCAAALPIAAAFDEPRLAGVVVALGLSLLINGLGNPRLAMAQRALQFWQDFVVSTGRKLAGFIVSVAIAVVFKSYWALVAGAIATQTASVILSYAVMPYRPRLLFRYWREFFSFSGWLTAGRIVNTLNWRFDQLLVGKMLGSTVLGFYTVGSNLALVPTRESTAPLTQTIYPAFASIRGDPVRLAAAYQRTQAFLTAVALPAGIGMALIADPLVRLTLGERWVPVIFIIQALASVYALQTLGSLAQPLGVASGEPRLLFVRDVQMLALRVPIIVFGTFIAGLEGLVVARVFTGLLSIPFNCALVRRFTGLSFGSQMLVNVRALISCAVMAVAVTLAARQMPIGRHVVELAIQVAQLVALGGLAYCGSMAALWIARGKPEGPETELRRLIARMLERVRPPQPSTRG